MSHDGEIKLVKNERFSVAKQDIEEGTLFIEINASAIKGDKAKVKIGVFEGDKLIETTKTTFLGPRSFN